MKKILLSAALLLSLVGTPAFATTSTINPTQPAQGSALSSSTLRSNFLAAYNDINAAFAQIAAAVTAQITSLTGDVTTLTPSGGVAVSTVGRVNGVSYSAAPSANTVPVVTNAGGGGTVTYEAVPNAALQNSSLTIAGHSVSLGGTQALAVADITGAAPAASPTFTGTVNGAAVTWSGQNQALNFSATGTGADTLPVGTTGQAPTASNGMIRYDSTLGKLRASIANAWQSVFTTADVIPVANGGFGSTPTAPSSPTAGTTWLSSSLAKLHASNAAYERYPLGIQGQEQNVWIYNNNYYDLFTNSLGYLAVMNCPTSADPTASSIFYGTVSGSTLTVTEPTNQSSQPSPDNGGIIQVGMTLQSGTGATITGQSSGTPGGAGVYTLSGSPGTVANNTKLSANFWSIPTVVIGGGNGGLAGTAAHSFVYIEGSNLYDYFVAFSGGGGFTAQNTYVATSTLSTPTTWTASSTPVLGIQGYGAANGNIGVYKVGSTYYMFQEALFSTVNPVEGATSGWKVMLATGTSPTGTFTSSISPLTSIYPNANAGAGHIRVYPANDGSGCYVAIYHVNSWERQMPSNLYRATNCNLATDTWVIQDNKAPFMQRAHAYEVDQVADPSFVQSPNGTPYLFYTAADNNGTFTTGFQMMVTPLFPTPYQYDGANWKIAQSGYDAPTQINNPQVLQNTNIVPALNPPIEISGTWTPTFQTGTGGSLALVSDTVQNDYIDYDIQGMSPGMYQLTYTYQTNSSGGVITSSLSDDTLAFSYNLVNQVNGLLYSNTFTTSSWTSANVTPAATSAVTDPVGGTGASILTASATGADRINQYNSQAQAGSVYTISAYMKSGTANGYLAFVQSGVQSYITCPLNGSAFTVSGTGATGTCIQVGATGWYRLTLTQPAASTASLYFAAGPQDNTGTSSGYPACTNAKTVYIYGAQYEQNSSASIYTPTMGATADTYSASAVNNVTYPITFSVLGNDTIRRKIRLKMATKNASSSAYGLSINGIALQRVTQ